MARTIVYCFTRETAGAEHGWHCLYPATLDVIRDLGGEPIVDTAMEVDDANLIDGRFFGAPNCGHRFHVQTFITDPGTLPEHEPH